MLASCFPPIADEHARVLILGSLPGQVSLQRQQYYALPQNAFWKIMGRLYGAGPEVPYSERTRHLMRNRIALWDVCAAAQRPGSLDSAIVRASVIPNDFSAFLAVHPKIELIVFNGAKAAELYRRLVVPRLPTHLASIDRHILPSTSPAYAAMSFEEKLAHWITITQSR